MSQCSLDRRELQRVVHDSAARDLFYSARCVLRRNGITDGCFFFRHAGDKYQSAILNKNIKKMINTKQKIYVNRKLDRTPL